MAMRRFVLYIALFGFALSVSLSAFAQESIFTGFKSDVKKAEECYQKHDYSQAISLYNRLVLKNPGNLDYMLKLANCYFFHNDMRKAVLWFGEFDKTNSQFSSEDVLRFAMALHAIGNYEGAIIRLTDYQQQFPDDLEVSRKIWQLQNIHFLQEDSAYFIIEKLPINTNFDEVGPVVHGNSMVFVSNRNRVSAVKRISTDNDKLFFSWYTTGYARSEGELGGSISINRINPFAGEIKSKLHKGGICFSSDENSMVYVRVVNNEMKKSKSTSMLFFADLIDNKWVETSSFPFNSSEHSIMHPFLSLDGKRLYFSSDMPGGFGGMDLYYSDLNDDKWSNPVNLGSAINTSQNEGHPFLDNTILYFSSNGHPGLGGLDIFHVDMTKQPIEVINQGYPVNTFHDDFNLVLNKNGRDGFFCSNRDQGKQMNDDIYGVQFTKLSFPLLVSGKISYKKSQLTEAETELMNLSNAEIELVNKESQETVFASTTDMSGNFTIEIPYESQFLLRVRQQELGEAIVSMEIPKNHRDYLSHDIVIVQDLFNILQNQKRSTK